MADLTWFKFSPGKWMMGRIMSQSNDTQALFIKLMCKYWNSGCQMTVNDARIEIGSEQIDLLLLHKILKKDRNKIHITFLDDQMSKISENSQKKRHAAKSRWNADAMHVHNDAMQNDADKIREEKIRTEEREIVANAPTPKGIAERKEDFYKQLVPFVKTYGKTMIRKFFEYWTESSKDAKKFRMEKEKVFDINRRLSTWAEKEKSYNPDADQPPKPGDQFADARYNKTLWTDQAWRETYANQIANDEDFRKEFNLTHEKLRESSTVGSRIE